jgi:class 3 adenylate cyclase/tetratricopeptide (TPR) repeat protein
MAVPESRRERKVVTVLFADLVGFTARAETLDPEDVEAILGPYHARLRGELERFGGTVEKFIGDAVMALFGAPVAHEDDPERAVRAALAIRDWVREEGDLDVRIAVTTGEALVSLGARPQEGEGMASGDVVNTAARLQVAAPVNGVLVGESTYRATREVVDYREADPVVAKGKVDAIPVWEAVEPHSRLGMDLEQRTLQPLVGRVREAAVLQEAFDRARSEREPQLVTVVGVPGIGKSRLVAELFQRIDAAPEIVGWRQGRALPYGSGVSFWALGEMVKAQAGIHENDDPDDAAAKLRTSVEAALDEGGDVEWVAGHLRPLVGLGEEDDAPAERREESFAAWRRYLEALAEQRPLVLVFEDLHWADDGLLDFVDHLADWASGVPLLVLGTARPELLDRRPGWGGGKLNATTIGLSPLDDADAARLIASVLDRAVLPVETQAALLERAGGNPLYAEQFARLFLERGSVDDLPLPENVQGLIAARIDALPPAEKRLLQDAAVLGKVFWSGGLTSLGGLESGAVAAALHPLERKGFVRRERRSAVAGEEEYAFRHVLVREVAYGQIPRAERAEKHRRAAEWMESLGRPDDHAELLAHHYAAALELARAARADTPELLVSARTALARAGARAYALGAFPGAVRFYRDALALAPPGDPDRGELLLAAGRALRIAEDGGDNELTEAAALFEQTEERELAAEAETALADAHWRAGRHADAVTHLDRALAHVDGLTGSRARAFVLAEAARVHSVAGDERAVAVGEEALVLAEELGLDGLQVSVLCSLGVARAAAGDGEAGRADLERAVELAASTPAELGRALNNLSFVTGLLGDTATAREYAERAMEFARSRGDVRQLRWSRAGLAWVDYQRGYWDKGLEAMESFIAEIEDGSPHYLEGLARMVRGFIRLARDDDAGAVDDIERVLAQGRLTDDPQSLLPSLGGAAWVFALAGDDKRAHALLDELVGLHALAGAALNAPIEMLASMAVLGRPEVGLLLFERAFMSPWREAGTLLLTGDCAAAAEIYDRLDAPTGAACVRLVGAKALAAAGDLAEADEQLGRALAFYRSVGATRYVREAEALVRATA